MKSAIGKLNYFGAMLIQYNQQNVFSRAASCIKAAKVNDTDLFSSMVGNNIRNHISWTQLVC